MDKSKTRQSRERWGALSGGLVLIAVGMVFLLAELELVSMRHIWRWTPLLLIGSGLVRLITAERFAQVKSGLVLNLIGTWLLINFHGVWIFYFGNSWPLLLVGFGAIAILEAFFKGWRREPDADSAAELDPTADPHSFSSPPPPPAIPPQPTFDGNSDGGSHVR